MGFGSVAPPHGDGDMDVYMATYPGSSELQRLPNNLIGSEDEIWFQFPTFTVPYGQSILSAKMTLSFATEQQYSFEPAAVLVLPLAPDQPAVPGRIMETVTTRNSVFPVFGECTLGPLDNVQDFDLMHLGCNPLTRDGQLGVSMFGLSFTEIVPTVIDPGFNSETDFTVRAGNGTPITGELDVVYTPEPSPLALIGTGMVLLAGIIFMGRARVRASRCL
jgi:hypothetical protein